MKNTRTKIAAAVFFLINAPTIFACPWCRAEVKSKVYAEDFVFNLFVLLLPILILIAAGISLYFKDEITERIKEKIKQWKMNAK